MAQTLLRSGHNLDFRDRLGPGLTSLGLHKTTVTAGTMADLGKLSKLTGLDLGAAKIGDNDLTGLQHLPRLQTLSLFDTGVTDAGLVHLRSIKKLKVLILPSGATNAGLVAIKELRGLQQLYLSGS